MYPSLTTSIYDNPGLFCYNSTPPWESNFKYIQLDPCICNGNIVDFSVPAISNEMMREILGINTNTKETKKMEAKKCDRCGKLYEMGNPWDDTSIKVRFKYEFVADKEGMSEQRIIEKQTGKVAIRYDSYSSTDRIDLCPDCIESFKRWFENG